MSSNFWEEKKLIEMTPEEWELLCDKCGRCCLNKLEDEDTGEIYFTNVACQLLDIDNCQCTDYKNRLSLVQGCLKVNISTVSNPVELPESCAYRLLAVGQKLQSWHPLVTGNPDSVHQAGISVKNKVVSEEFIHQDQLVEHIITWEPALLE